MRISLCVSTFVSAIFCCGSWASDSSVQLKLVPDRPLLLDSHLAYNRPSGGITEVDSPWFRFQVSVATSTEPVTISAVQVTMNGPVVNGRRASTTTTFLPQSDNYTTDSGAHCVYTDFGQFDPGGTLSNIRMGRNINETRLYEFPSDGTANGCHIISPSHYVSFPGAQHGSTAEIKLLGWYGTRNHPARNFEQTIQVQVQ